MRASCGAHLVGGDDLGAAAPAGEALGDHRRARRADLHLDATVVGLAELAEARPELAAQPVRRQAVDADDRPHAGCGAPPSSSTTACHVSARSKSAGRTTGSVGALDRADAADPERPHPGVGAGDQVPHRPLVDETERVHGAHGLVARRGRRSRGAPGRRRRRPAAARRGGLGAAGRRRPSAAGSSTMADAAASASARNVSGSACTSLRSAALASGVAVDDGPATRNSVRASAAVSPLRSVRAPPISDQPPPRPACE